MEMNSYLQVSTNCICRQKKNEEIETQKAIFYLQQKDAEEEAGGEPNA
jgi:hypothetical protein